MSIFAHLESQFWEASRLEASPGSEKNTIWQFSNASYCYLGLVSSMCIIGGEIFSNSQEQSALHID